MAPANWPPQIGEPLPRVVGAWCTEEKWVGWILAEHGHGAEWNRVFHVGPDEWGPVWKAIAEAVPGASIQMVRETGLHGVSCEMLVDLAIKGRIATVATAWHYADEHAVPRLITAYPRPYNRSNGSRA